MNPSGYEQSGLPVPQLPQEGGQMVASMETVQVAAPELQPLPQAQPVMAPMTNPLMPIQLADPISGAQPPQTSATLPAANLIADDTDLIEKAWVNKAKQIVEQTKEDPRAQSQELNNFKATYLKQRYNKDIKVSDNK